MGLLVHFSVDPCFSTSNKYRRTHSYGRGWFVKFSVLLELLVLLVHHFKMLSSPYYQQKKKKEKINVQGPLYPYTPIDYSIRYTGYSLMIENAIKLLIASLFSIDRDKKPERPL